MTTKSLEPSSRRLVFLSAVLALLFSLLGCVKEPLPENTPYPLDAAIPSVLPLPDLASADQDLLLAHIEALMAGDVAPPTIPLALNGQNFVVYIALRKEGRLLGWGWGSAGGAKSFEDAWVRANRRLPETAEPDIIELVLGHGFRTVRVFGEDLGNAQVGEYGMELFTVGGGFLFAPTYMIANNIGFKEQLFRFAKLHDIDEPDFPARIRVRRFKTFQYLVTLGKAPRIIPIKKGDQPVSFDSISRASVDAFYQRIGDWLIQQIRPNGRLVYLYQPGIGKEHDSDNEIRQWMSSYSLVRLAQERADDSLTDRTAVNIDYNLGKNYREEDGLGYLDADGRAALGTLAGGGLALMHHPLRDKWRKREQALVSTIEYLWNEDGSFRTFFKPEGQTGGENFYSGEALLLLAFRYRESLDEALLGRIMRSYAYYREWHLADRVSAFVPWHTQACYLLWEQTRAPALRDWIFDMNDWLVEKDYPLALEVAEVLRKPVSGLELVGNRHSSGIGVHLEGLIDAFRLARAVGDDAREERYRRAVLIGILGLMQLEFTDNVDMFYVADKDAVRGGLRSRIYDNEIRIDNHQHALLALQKIRDAFTQGDYAW